jgi:hypothetical protein
MKSQAKLVICMYCGKEGHLMSKCIHASQFIERISKAASPDEGSSAQSIEINSTTSTEVYESLTDDSQIDSLITNHQMWKSGQTALFRHDSNIYIKATISRQEMSR